MLLLEKLWEIFRLLFVGLFGAAADYLPIVYVFALILIAISLFRKFWRL